MEEVVGICLCTGPDPCHFMYHVELLRGKGERQMNIAYWSAHETGCSDPAGGLLHCFHDRESLQWLHGLVVLR